MLVHTLMSVPDEDILVFSIVSTRNIYNLSFLVHEIGSLESEELEPSGVSLPYLEVVGSSCVLDVE